MTTQQDTDQCLLLKWGTLKGYAGAAKGTPFRAAIDRYHEQPTALGVMQQSDTPEQKQAICDAIDAVIAAGGVVKNDWSGETMTAEDAKKYVMEYRR